MAVVPEKSRSGLIIRKLVHEKCVEASALPGHWFRKIERVARPDDYLEILDAGMTAGIGGAMGTKLKDLTRGFLWMLTVALVSVLLVRCVFASAVPVHSIEWFVYGTAAVQLGVVVVFTEVAATYDAVLGVCCPVAMAVLVKNAGYSAPCEQAVSLFRLSRSVFCLILFGLIATGVVTIGLMSLGLVFQSTGSGFVDFRETRIEVLEGSEHFDVEAFREGVSVRFRSRTEVNRGDGSVVRCKVVVTGLPSDALQGFISGNQYRDMIPSPERFEAGVAKCNVWWGREPVFSGDISGVNTPRWFSCGGGNQSQLSIELEVNGQLLDRTDTEYLPVVAIEYFFAGHRQF